MSPRGAGAREAESSPPVPCRSGLISRGMTTYEFIIGQRQEKKERDARRGGPPSRSEACLFEMQNQAPWTGWRRVPSTLV